MAVTPHTQLVLADSFKSLLSEFHDFRDIVFGPVPSGFESAHTLMRTSYCPRSGSGAFAFDVLRDLGGMAGEW